LIIDGESAYFGSVNFTGAGLGFKNVSQCNLELGALIKEKESILQLDL